MSSAITFKKYTPFSINIVDDNLCEQRAQLRKADEQVLDCNCSHFHSSSRLQQIIKSELKNRKKFSQELKNLLNLSSNYSDSDFLSAEDLCLLIKQDTSQNVDSATDLFERKVLKALAPEYAKPTIINYSNQNLVCLSLQQYPFNQTFKNVMQLNISSNNIKELPSDISELINLEFFDISFNAIKALPSSIKKIRSLRSLNVSHNNIESVNTYNYFEDSDFFLNLSKLEDLNISFNNLCEIPSSVGLCLNALNSFQLTGNKFENYSNIIQYAKNNCNLNLTTLKKKCYNNFNVCTGTPATQLDNVLLTSPGVPVFDSANDLSIEEDDDALTKKSKKLSMEVVDFDRLFAILEDESDLKYLMIPKKAFVKTILTTSEISLNSKRKSDPQQQTSTNATNISKTDHFNFDQSDMQKSLAKRIKICQEIVETEKTYIEVLQNLVEIYINPIRNEENNFGFCLTKDEDDLLFSNIESILSFHKKFELLDNTVKNHPDRKNLEKAFNAIESSCLLINEEKRMEEERELERQILRKLKVTSDSIGDMYLRIGMKRKFLKQGILILVKVCQLPNSENSGNGDTESQSQIRNVHENFNKFSILFNGQRKQKFLSRRVGNIIETRFGIGTKDEDFTLTDEISFKEIYSSEKNSNNCIFQGTTTLQKFAISKTKGKKFKFFLFTDTLCWCKSKRNLEEISTYSEKLCNNLYEDNKLEQYKLIQCFKLDRARGHNFTMFDITNESKNLNQNQLQSDEKSDSNEALEWEKYFNEILK
ncbi:hypothetical protein HK099_007861 [Clydaea vesicula]|uniref:DH domain-containing protein n=1 Tax=Clydaea vesicula TaxID=447962 RepID=A0AAD5U578_9FUNG|nr:hypothetical protein HK099_007861 [Clydaea vesicula]